MVFGKKRKERTQLETNIRANNFNGLFNSLAQNMVLPFLGVFARDLGASSFQFGLLNALPSAVSTISFLPALPWIERQKEKVKFTAILTLIARMFYPLFALATLLDNGVYLLLAFYGLSALPWSWSSLSWKSLVGDAIPEDSRDHAFSQRNRLVAISSILITLLAGMVMDALKFPWSYRVVFLASFIFSLAEVSFLFRMKPLVHLSEARTTIPLRMIFKVSPEYRRFTIGNLIFQIGYQGLLPLFTIYTVQNLKATPGWVSLISIASAIGQIAFYPLWAKFSRRFGQRLLISLASFLMALSPIFYALSTNLLSLVIFNFFIGAFWAGYYLVSFNFLLTVSPSDSRERYIAIFNTLTNATGIFLPLLGVGLSSLIGIRLAFLVGAAFRAGSGLYLFLKLERK
ncbi:MAG: MFS transporter [Caldiserica bacterium]|jgi:MFS family permease|nr:MFS transporter [Caldisericota bacterium]MDH7562808.1 MFS transporter [Caldisericota bacterium]